MNYQMVIAELQAQLISNPDPDKIRYLLRSFGKFGVLITTLHKGKVIIRARPSEKEPFGKASDLSYKPQKHNKTYQRASTPLKTMFYGSIVPEISGENEPQTARITIGFELSEFIRSKSSTGELDLTYSAWEVMEDIELVSLIHHKKFERPTKMSIELQQRFELMCRDYPNLREPTLAISEFLGNEFAKLPILKQEDYMISALYSEIVSSKYDGVLYPSVRLGGEGINVAIKPETVDTKLRFIEASECTFYKNGLQVYLGNNTKSTIKENGTLEFNRLDDQFYVSRMEGRKIVGLE